MSDLKNLIAFEENIIRSTWYNGELYFVIRDIVKALTNSKNPSGYIKDMRRRDKELAKGWGQIATPLLIETKGGKQKIACANTKGIFRIIQSIPSPKAEPFKQWLAKVGHERVQEIENPELAIERIKEAYRLKGYNEKWIEVRLQSIGIRKKLTDEWQKRGVKVGKEYALLTSEISQATFGLTPSQHKKIKGLKRHNLRDHMTDTELVFTMLGEIRTREEAQEQDAQGFPQNKVAARKGGEAAHEALQAYEKKTGKKVVSPKNFLAQIKEAKEKQKLERKEKKKGLKSLFKVNELI